MLEVGKDAAASEAGPPADSGRPAAVATGWRRWLRWEAAAFLELAAVCGFALAQPMLDITGRAPDFFLYYGAGRRDIVALLLAVTLLLPMTLWALGAITGIAGQRVRRVTHVVLLALCLVFVGILLGKRLTTIRGLPLALAAAVAGAGLAVLYTRGRALSQFFRLASIGPLVFALLFVFASPSGALLLPRKDATSGAVGAATGAAQPPIVMIMFDEFPLISLMGSDGRIDAKRYPNFAALAGGSTWYRNATSVSGWTPFAMPSMLTGVYPYKASAPFYVDYPNNLFTALGKTYSLEVQETIALLCPPSACGAQPEPPGGSARAVLGNAVDLAMDVLSPNDSAADPTAAYVEPTTADPVGRAEAKSDKKATFRFGETKRNQPSRFTEFLDGLQRSKSPTMNFLHMLLPHGPYRFLASGMEYTAPNRLAGEGETFKAGEWWLRSLRERYEPQLAYTDRLIGDFLRTLRDRGLYDDALVIVTADHGVKLTTPSTNSRQLINKDTNKAGGEHELLWVPLFIKEPGQREGRIDDRNWEQIDLLPTIAGYAGVKIPWRYDGLDARTQRRATTEKHFYDWPGVQLKVDGPTGMAKVLKGWEPLQPPVPGLLGKRLDELRITEGGPPAKVQRLSAFDQVRPERGKLPAFVWGTLPRDTASGRVVAIAVNGKIGALGTTARQDADNVWFAGFINDERLFVPGANKLELFLVDGESLQRLRVDGS